LNNLATKIGWVNTTGKSLVVQPASKVRYLSELAVFQDLTPREMQELIARLERANRRTNRAWRTAVQHVACT
jgi:hypothetical protein